MHELRRGFRCSLGDGFHGRLAGHHLLQVDHAKATEASEVPVAIEGRKTAQHDGDRSPGPRDGPVQAEIAPGLPARQGRGQKPIGVGAGLERKGGQVVLQDGAGRPLDHVAELARQAGDQIAGIRLPQEPDEGGTIEPPGEISRKRLRREWPGRGRGRQDGRRGGHGAGRRDLGHHDRRLRQRIGGGMYPPCERCRDGDKQGPCARDALHREGDQLFGAIHEAAQLLHPSCSARAQAAIELQQAGKGGLLAGGDPQGKALFITGSKQEAGGSIGANQASWTDREDKGGGALCYGSRKRPLRERSERLGAGRVLVHAHLVHREALSSGTGVPSQPKPRRIASSQARVRHSTKLNQYLIAPSLRVHGDLDPSRVSAPDG